MKRIIVLLLTTLPFRNVVAQIPLNELSIWLKSDTAITSSGDNVISWGDQSGNHLDAISVVNKNYSYPKLIPGALNDYPAIRFNGNNTGMITPAFVTFPKKRGTIIIVTKINGRSATSGVGLGNLVATFHGKGVVWQFGASPIKFAFYDGFGNEGSPVSGSSPSEWGIVMITRINDTTMIFYREGRNENTFQINNNQPDSNPLKIGFNGRLGSDSIPEVLNGDIAEIIIYGRNLTTDEISEVHQYLSHKYDLALAPPPFWLRWWFIGIVLFFITLIVFAVAQYISRQKLKKKIAQLEKQKEIENERQRISREMHDDIGAGLTQIVLMSEAIKNKSDGSGGKELTDIANTSRRLVDKMSEIIWSLSPEQKTLEDLCAYLREQINMQLEYSEIEYNIDLPSIDTGIILSNEQRRNILLVVKEIINNAVKYSRAKNINIKAEIKNGGLDFEIADNGIGFDAEKNYSGNGLRNIKTRIDELKGNLQVQTAPGQGCRFHFFIPLRHNT